MTGYTHAVKNKSDNIFWYGDETTLMYPGSPPDILNNQCVRGMWIININQRTLLDLSPVRQRINALPQQPP